MELLAWYVRYLLAAERGWFAFWHVLWSAEWVANVGLPMIVSLAALLIAYHFFRTQLDHDRTLAADQAERDRVAGAEQAQRDRDLMREQIVLSRQESERERRREAVRILGSHIYGLGEDGDSGDPVQPIDIKTLTETIERAQFVVGIHPIFRQIQRAAQGCNMRATIAERFKQTAGADFRKFALYYINANFVTDYMLEMRVVAEVCFKWNGDDTLEEIPQVHAPTEAQANVMSPDYDEFEKELRQQWNDLVGES